MRDLVFRNSTSSDRRKRVISSCETLQRQGMRIVIRRHFVCKVIEISDTFIEKPLSQVYVSRICSYRQQQERFFFRMKASIYARSKGRLFLILFGHSLKIDSRPAIKIIS